MKIINTFEITNPDGTVIEQVTIQLSDNALETMPRAEYDRRQAEQSTPIVIDEATTI
jgi:hypothetical protein